MNAKRFVHQEQELAQLTRDFLTAAGSCWRIAGRVKRLSDNALVLRQIDDLMQSALAVFSLAREGVHSPVRRELCHMLAACVRTLYVDQQHPEASLEHRTVVLQEGVHRSWIEKLGELRLEAFGNLARRKFEADMRALHAELSRYVPAPRQQVETALRLMEKGHYPGFAAETDLAGLNKDIFRLYEILIVLLLHGIGMTLAGEVFVKIFDEEPEWTFHKGVYIDQMSTYFDYKYERRSV